MVCVSSGSVGYLPHRPALGAPLLCRRLFIQLPSSAFAFPARSCLSLLRLTNGRRLAVSSPRLQVSLVCPMSARLRLVGIQMGSWCGRLHVASTARGGVMRPSQRTATACISGWQHGRPVRAIGQGGSVGGWPCCRQVVGVRPRIRWRWLQPFHGQAWCQELMVS